MASKSTVLCLQKEDEMRVVCIDNENGLCDLTIGKEYNVLDDRNDVFGYRKSRFEIINEENDMIKIRRWKDLTGLESKDKWGNRTVIKYSSDLIVEIITYGLNGACEESYSRSISTGVHNITKGGCNRVLEELRLCGFNVEFIEKPNLTDQQRQELKYMRDIVKAKHIAKDKSGECYTFVDKPFKTDGSIWWSNDNITYPTLLNYDFILWEDDEPWSIEELLNESDNK